MVLQYTPVSFALMYIVCKCHWPLRRHYFQHEDWREKAWKKLSSKRDSLFLFLVQLLILSDQVNEWILWEKTLVQKIIISTIKDNYYLYVTICFLKWTIIPQQTQFFRKIKATSTKEILESFLFCMYLGSFTLPL